MKKLNKLALSLGTVAAVAAPVAAVVACGSSSNGGGTISFPTIVARGKVGNATFDKTIARNVLVAVDGADHSVNDKSFNEQAEGAATALGAEDKLTKVDAVKPAGGNATDFATMYGAADANSIILAPGFAHVEPIGKATSELSDKFVVLVDGDVKAANVASVEFKTEQAAFLAGIASGNYLNAHADWFGEELKVGGFGGLNFPSVTSFLAGYQQGIEYFNAHKAEGQKDVSFIDLGSKNDFFSGGFAPGGGTAISQKLLANGADLILPVAGPQTADAIGAIKAANSNAQVIGVDTEQEKLYTNSQNGRNIVAFSVLKQIKKAFYDVVANLYSSTPDSNIKGFGELTIGDLDNGLVGLSQMNTGETLAPFASKINDPAVQTAAKATKVEFKY